MHAWVYYAAILWHLGLVVALAISALRSEQVVDRAVALDTFALVVVAALVLVGVRRSAPAYLDIALVLSLLGFAQTVATARVLEGRRDLQ